MSTCSGGCAGCSSGGGIRVWRVYGTAWDNGVGRGCGEREREIIINTEMWCSLHLVCMIYADATTEGH